jgi:hypothetical protein
VAAWGVDLDMATTAMTVIANTTVRFGWAG